MSAFLRDSQMWHFLKENGKNVELIDIRREGPYRNDVSRVLYKRSEAISKNFELITIIPLTRQKEVVSLSRYSKGILVPEPAEFVLKMALEKQGYFKTKDVMHLMANQDNIVLTERNNKALAAIKKYGAILNVFDWYCKTAIKVVDNIKRWGKLKGKPLAVANRKFKLDEFILTNYPRFSVIPIQSHGVNEYMNNNCIFFAAAINPDRESKHLYAALLPDYDFALDHVADACVQCVTRLSVRDTESKNRVYVIVPDMAMANFLRTKLDGIPSIDTTVANHYKMTAFNNLNKDRVIKEKRKKTTPEEKALASEARAKKWREGNRKLASARALKSRYKKQLLTLKGKEKRQLSHKIDLLDLTIGYYKDAKL